MIPLFLQPLIASGLSLVANAAMAKGSDWVKDKTGIDLKASKLTSEQMVQLRQFEMDHEVELLKIKQEDDRLVAEIEKAYLQDVASARTMQVAALQQEDKFAKRFIYYLAIGWSVATAAYIGFITFGVVPEDNVRFADTILGFMLGTLISQIINFFYGSSRSSQMKDETINKAMKE